ncbi:hypothetical protein HK100_007227 [Physocladia obscura]|uniref:C3H1-type domain-containing protein n=1 Tax=Physocladia obscura TaxID=109957 RepID=A0AAD5T9M0_9FUNG|nr:hypothetical protein HK100_007227 [Physocladia obscura]
MSNDTSIKMQIARLKAAIEQRKREQQQQQLLQPRRQQSLAVPATAKSSVAHPKSHNRVLVRQNGPSAPTTISPQIPKFIVVGNKLIREGVGIRGHIIVNGVEFKVDSRRKKLVRVDALPTGPKSKTNVQIHTPKRVLIGKIAYAKSISGNLIPITKTYCKHYMRGKCKLAQKCPFIHDPSRRLICHKFVFLGTCDANNACPLSHIPTPHNTPLCSYFISKRGCKNTECKFIHEKPQPGAKVCLEFAREGFCTKGLPDGKEKCLARHVWVCPDVDDGKKCSLGDKCKLPPCSLIRKGLDPGKYLNQSNNGQLGKATNEKKSVEVKTGDEQEQEQEVRKPDFLRNFNPRVTSVGEYDPNEIAARYAPPSDDEDQSELDEDEDEEMESYGNDFGIEEGDIIDLDWDGDE